MATIKFKNAQGQWEELSAAKLETARNINGVPFDGTQDITIPGSGGTSDYLALSNKPYINGIELIGNLTSGDLGVQPAGSYITSESDPTVPDWAKQPTKPTYIASEVGALSSTTTISTIGGYPSNPTLNRFLRDDKTFSEIVAGSGGYAANVYLTNMNSDIANYKKISYTPEVSETTLTTTSTNATTLIKEYLYDYGVGVSLLDAGAWTFSIYCKLNVLSGNNSIRADLYKKTALSGEVVLLSATSNFILNTDYQRLKFESNFGSITVDPADRIGVKLYFTTTSLTPVVLSLLVGGNNASYFNTPVALRHSQLRGLNDDPAIQHITNEEKTQGALATGNTALPAVKDVADYAANLNRKPIASFVPTVGSNIFETDRDNAGVLLSTFNIKKCFISIYCTSSATAIQTGLLRINDVSTFTYKTAGNYTNGLFFRNNAETYQCYNLDFVGIFKCESSGIHSPTILNDNTAVLLLYPTINRTIVDQKLQKITLILGGNATFGNNSIINIWAL